MNIDCTKIPLQDKGCHFIAGFIITLIVGFIAYFLGAEYPQAYGITLGVIAGIGKELYDKYDYGDFDFFDAMVTGVGAFFGGLIVTLVV